MPNSLSSERIAAYCALRLPPLVDSEIRCKLTETLANLSNDETPLPIRQGRILYSALSLSSGIDVKHLRRAHAAILPLVAAMARARSPASNIRKVHAQRQCRPKRVALKSEVKTEIELPARFDLALAKLMALHGDSAWRVSWALRDQGLTVTGGTLREWASGKTRPRGRKHWPHLRAIAERYGLPARTLIDRLAPTLPVARSILDQVPKSVRAHLAWHLPSDFAERSVEAQGEILDWIARIIGSGSTDYRRYLLDRLAAPYALPLRSDDGVTPLSLHREVENLLTFKTAVFVPIGQQRNGVWGVDTAEQKRLQLGQMFGALAALGVKSQSLSLALLVVPSIWDAWLRWREARRGFYIQGEADLLRLAQSLVRPGTGWLRQSPHLRQRLRVIKGLLSRDDIATIREDWAGACDRLLAYARGRASDIRRVARVHRDPFEPILPVLESDSPIGEYRRICDEIERRMPDADAHPMAAAEAVRSLLMLRLGLHLGLRQKNLRELLLCPRGRRPTPERKLEVLKRGEVRWSATEQAWEVLIPAVAFKNVGSSFFEGRAFRVLLPDLGGLYALIAAWVKHHRPVLVGQAVDPGAVFVATSRGPKTALALSKSRFYALWRETIARYGVFNPYTGRGAIAGLLPHGPHGVRDVLATHILKATGSYEHAGYAIQDTAETVARHYGRFLPKDKSALAALIINKVWLEDQPDKFGTL